MIYNKREFGGGLALLVLFFVVLFVMFQPMFKGHNAMEYLDALYNSISKGSVYYVPAMKEQVETIKGKDVAMTLDYGDTDQAGQTAAMFVKSGINARAEGSAVTVNGSLDAILLATLADSDFMYHNDGKAVSEKYSLEPRRALFNWWTTLKLVDKYLKSQNAFAEAKVTATIQKKAVETAYNYFEVEPVHIMDKLGLVIFSLAFYVIYTLWYGFAILFLFEGWGLKLSH
ncbi:hypothetical protein [uncultured Pseudodesulfovibrio sp.]|uniref:hypothetical protein n=1 Tax=uncultured Pseudodesulfovibrio sp. TaxID=2035858 RepID=UPI0029C8320B|nr:hypothetical protein [uncultured Pseudodesulfovibrio sp.]